MQRKYINYYAQSNKTSAFSIVPSNYNDPDLYNALRLETTVQQLFPFINTDHFMKLLFICLFCSLSEVPGI